MSNTASSPKPAAGGEAGAPGFRTAAALANLAAGLAERGEIALATLPSQRLLAAWQQTISALRDPRSAERQAFEPALVRSSGLSPQGLVAALDVILDGVSGEAAEAMFHQASAAGPGRGVALVILAGNLPGLATQPLLRLLASRQPALLKSASAEPVFAPALVQALVAREPALAAAYAAVVWQGGDHAIELALLRHARQVVAYGDTTAIESLESRAPGRIEAHGPRASLAVVGANADLSDTADGIARDIALFDQRGCLSVQAVYTAGDARALAEELALALGRRAREWPAGPISASTAVAVQQLRAAAELRGLLPLALPLATGTIVIEPELAFRASPGARTVRIHPLAELDRLLEVLVPWRGRLQGVATAGALSAELRRGLSALGVTRIASAGQLQQPDARWDGRAPATCGR